MPYRSGRVHRAGDSMTRLVAASLCAVLTLLPAHSERTAPNGKLCRLEARKDGLPPWHLQPFGCHADPESPVTEFGRGVIPHPQDFYREFIATRQPAVLRGAIDQAAGIAEWDDERLMASDYGSMHVKLEGKREKRSESNAALTGVLTVGRDLLGHFVNRTRRAGPKLTGQVVTNTADVDAMLIQVPVTNIDVTDNSEMEGYVVSQLPDPMATDVMVPAVATCGSLSQQLLEANLWVSSGNTSSMIHRDADNVFNCVYRGSKTWTLIDPLMTPQLPTAEELEGEIGGVALVNPDAVDASTDEGEAVGKLPYRRVTVHAGDCLFLPWGYWHQVYSTPGRNIAVSLLYTVSHTFQDADGDCDQAASAEVEADGSVTNQSDQARMTIPKPGQSASSSDTVSLRLAPWLSQIELTDADLLFGYDGRGEMSMGNNDPEALRLQLMNMCKLPWTIEQFPVEVSPERAARALREAETARAAIYQAMTELDGAVEGVTLRASGVKSYEELDDPEMELDDAPLPHQPEQRRTRKRYPISAAFVPNMWSQLDAEPKLGVFAGAVSQRAAELLGVTSPFRHDVRFIVSDTENRIGRRLSHEEVQLVKMETRLVGMGIGVAWGGVMTETAFKRSYVHQVIAIHTPEDDDEDDDDDSDSDDDDDDDDDNRRQRHRQKRLIAMAQTEAQERAEAADLDADTTATVVKDAVVAAERRIRARQAKMLQLRSAAEDEAEALWDTVLDVESTGIVSVEDILRVPRRAIVSVVRVGAGFDPANTEEWEFYLQDGDAVRSLLLKAWQGRAETMLLYAQLGHGGDTTDEASSAIANFLKQAAGSGCGVLQLGSWRQAYMENLEGTDAAADRVSEVVLATAATSGPCSGSATAPHPLRRPKSPAEGGDPSTLVPYFVALPESAIDEVLTSVTALYAKQLKHDPALDELAALEFS